MPDYSRSSGRLELQDDASPSRNKLLIVDDNRDVAETLRALLELYHFEVNVAHTGAQALTLAATLAPDVILIDLGMPTMNGFQLVRSLKKRTSTPALLVAMTGWPRPDDAVTTRAVGYDHYVVKPIDTDKLTCLIKTSLARAPSPTFADPIPPAYVREGYRC